MLKVGGNEVTELSGSGHDSSYYDDRSDHERERHKEKKKKKKKKSEKDKDKHVDDEERRRRKASEWATTDVPHACIGLSVCLYVCASNNVCCFQEEKKKKKELREQSENAAASAPPSLPLPPQPPVEPFVLPKPVEVRICQLSDDNLHHMQIEYQL